LLFHTAHWRGEARTRTAARAARNAPLALRPGAPDISALPATLSERTPATDPLPPLRQNATYYATSYAAEVLTRPEPIVEEVGRDGADRPVMASVLDTLYYALGGDALSSEPVMTYYRGSECGPTVFSGFPLWYFTRSQQIQLVDFVLQRLWGLPRRPDPR
jgi:hypothetical protein